ncbi:MAG: DUF4276 family protein [Chitinispirillales bacterium]|jgi:hypothetical protein|nr:DUF4276 family protein [Chitinispirillales bacterium]
MKYLACFLEEQSAKEMLKGILPRLLPDDIEPKYIVFEGKYDLEKQLVHKLQRWLEPDTFFLVMRDQDSSECKDVKKKLSDLCREAGKPETLVRIACHELESFYFGDLSAVEKGLGISNIAGQQKKAKYRDPDSIIDPSGKLKILTKGNYQHIMGSRNIAPHLSLDNNASRSFNALVSGIKKLLATAI